MHTERGFDRLVNFSDAVVAIAITLLVLPLVDIPSEIHGNNAWRVVTDHSNVLLSFVISFVVISVLWRAHHRIFERLDDYTGLLMRVNFFWLFTIVLIPFPTAMIGTDGTDRFVLGFYFGTLMVSSTLLSIMSVISWTHSQRNEKGASDGKRNYSLLGMFVTPFLFAIIIVVVVSAPQLGSWAALLLFLESPIDLLLKHFGFRQPPSPERKRSKEEGAA